MTVARLSLADLKKHDPGSNGVRFCCPFGDCTNKPKDAAHRTLRLDKESGRFLCHRCSMSGMLTDNWTQKGPRPKATIQAIFAAKPATGRVAVRSQTDHSRVVDQQLTKLIALGEEMRWDGSIFADDVISIGTLLTAVMCEERA